MASKSSTKEAKERNRLPPNQQRELDKDGRCRRLFCDIFRLRVVAYIMRQPTPFTFILSLFLISLTLPLVGLYISRKEGLPDLDAMQNWNAYIGRLGRKDFCFNVSGNSMSEGASLYDSVSEDGSFLGDSGAGSYTVGVMIDFLVNKSLVTPSSTRNSVEEELILFGSFHGSDFSTQIKDSTGKRIDSNVLIHFLLNTSSVNLTEACPGDTKQCKVGTCVLITAPGDAVPTRLPQVHHNATFLNKVFWSDIKRRPRECSFFNGTSDVLKPDRDISKFNSSQMVYFNITRHVKVRNVTRCSSSTDEFEKLYLPGVRRGASKGHGIIRINLSQDDQQTAANHMYIAALAIAAVAIAFAVCITFTDRPPQPKSSQE